MTTITDLETFMLDNSDKIFRFLVYRRLFTPYEQDLKAIDESFYEDTYYSFARLEEAIDLGGGEWLLGLRIVSDIDGKPYDMIEYYKLSEIRLACFQEDQDLQHNCFDDEDDEEE